MKRKPLRATITICIRCVIVLCSLGLAGCTKPVPVVFSNVCQKENNNAYISVEGYLRAGASVFCSSHDGTRSCGLEMTDNLDGTNKISVYLDEGTGKSQVEPVPKNYSNENLRVRDHLGQVLGSRDKVRVIGVAKNESDGANPSFNICYINVQTVERP